MKFTFLFSFLSVLLSFSLLAQDIGQANMPGAGNPIFPGYYADPTVRKFGDIYYVYATTDNEMLASGAPTIWYSRDFQNWYNYTMEIPSLESINLRNYWAPDIIHGDDGRFYLYFGNCQAGCNIYGYVSDHPTGPWQKLHEDDTPVIPVGFPRERFPSLDAQFFKDDDGKIYGYWGTWVHYNNGYAVGELDNQRLDTMITGTNIPIDQTPNPFEAPFMMKKGDKYILMYSSESCHDETYNVRYSYSDSPYGPFTPGQNNPVLSSNDDLSVHGPGHHSVFQEGDNYYIAYHRHDYPMTRGGLSRQVCVDSMLFENDSTIRTVTPTHSGIAPFMPSEVPTDVAFLAGAEASSYYHITTNGYNYKYKPSYATDNNNSTMWKASDNTFPQTLTIDLEEIKTIRRVMTSFEFASYYYQYTLEYSEDGENWSMFADRSDNNRSGSPMIDDNDVTARYLKLTVLGTEKTGLLAAVWNIKVYTELFDIPLGLKNQPSAAGPGDTSKRELVFGFDAADLEDGDDLNAIKNIGSAGGTFVKRGDLELTYEDGVKAIEFKDGALVLEDVAIPERFAWNGSFTVSTWVKNPNIPRDKECLASWCNRRKWRLANSWNALFYNRGNFGAAAHLDGHFDIRYREVPAADEWHHITLTFDGVVEKIYVDGRLDNSQIMTLMSAIEDAEFIIGNSDNFREEYTGYMSSLRMYDYALSKDEITKIRDNTNPKPVN